MVWEDGGVNNPRKLALHLAKNCTSKICLCDYFGTLGSVEGLQPPGEDLESKL